MAVGTARYADVIAALGAAGLPTVFTQTGGMCAALEVTLETGQHLLITDAEDSLSWGRDEQRGWGVGLYAAPSEYDDGPLAFAAVDEDCSTATLFALVGEGTYGETWTGPLSAGYFLLLTGRVDGLLVARRTIRQLAAEPESVDREMTLHGARMHALHEHGITGASATARSRAHLRRCYRTESWVTIQYDTLIWQHPAT